MPRVRFVLPAVLAALALAATVAQASVETSDPSPSLRPPAAMATFAIPSHGAAMNGLVYLAAGPGPHPVVVFLHGYPGNERNLDLAQAVRRAGFDALYFNYRGAWGSPGMFSFAHALEDVDAVLAWVRAPETVAEYGFDPRRVAMVGHSFGGWLALLTAPHEPAVCVAALAAWNVGWDGQRFAAHPDERRSSLIDLHDATDGGAIHAAADDLLAEMVGGGSAWNYLTLGPALAPRALLLVAATRDSPDEDVTMHADLAARVRAAGGKPTVVEYEDDHAFSSHRLALAGAVTGWLDGACRAAWSRPRTAQQ